MAISIKLTERSYGGKKFRPQTVVDFEPSSNLLICVTPWGRPEIADKVIQSIKSFVIMAKEDTEMTVMYSRKENLQKIGNVLRMSVIQSSEKIFKEYNSDEYVTGFEVFAGIQDGPQWTYISCGQPSFVVKRSHIGLVPLSQSVDMNVLNSKALIQDPLPNQLLGIGQHPPIQFGSLRLKESDQYALVSRTYLPNEFYQLEGDEFNPENIARTLANENQDVPFWLGFLELDQR